MKSENLKKIHQLTESFINEVEKMSVNEGLTDTARAKWAGLKGGIKGFGKQIQGNVNKATGDVLSKGINYVAKGIGADTSKSTWAKNAQDLSKKGASQIDTGKNLAYNEKYNSYLKSVVNTIVNDLDSLDIKVNDKNKLVGDLNKSITNNTNKPANGIAAKGKPKPSTPAQSSSTLTTAAPTKPISTQTSQAAAPISAPLKPSVAPTSPTPTQSKMLGSKGMPKQFQQTPPKGHVLSASGRQFVPIGNNKPLEDKPKKEAPVEKPQSTDDAKKEANKKIARDKVHAEIGKSK